VTASEKLRALDVKPELISLSAHPALAALDVVDANVFAQLFNVLPQLVAVVEAAERIPPWPAAGTQKPRRKLAEALAALEKALP
jgi:hypothetical protein